MSENILVVEYEPRYTDRVRQALTGQPITASFAKDGEEAMHLLQAEHPSLIVVSSVVPKIATADLIRAIRGQKPLETIPILVTVSGYNGKSPKSDAQRIGATDILPKPYTESDFLGKVRQLLGIPVGVTAVAGGQHQLTSNEIFGDIFEDERPASTGATKTMKPKDDVDKMLAEKLAGVMPPRKGVTSPGNIPVPKPAEAKPKHEDQFEKKLHDTLSGLEKNARNFTSPGSVPHPKPAAVPQPEPSPSPAPSTKPPEFVPDDVHFAQPIMPGPAAQPGRIEDDEPTDGIRFGQYVLKEKIASGGMAEVWKARMRGVEGFQKIVAIKKILPHLSDNQDFIEMFVDEAKLAAQLNHSNIIHIYDLGKIQNSYYIAMEYVDGHDLKTILKRAQDRDQPIQVEVALFVAAKIAAALDYAHRKRDFEGHDLGLVHRDVSPQNVLISQDGDIKLCDFGIAKAASKASHTQAGALKGKLQYMSPEQAWGRNIDRRSDIFALGAVLFEMLASRKLFTGDNEMSVLEQVREAAVVKPSEFNEEVTPEIDRIVQKTLEKDPAARYQTAGEMEKDINAILYSFRPTPTAADLAIFMHRLWSPEVAPTLHDAETMIEKPPPTIAVAGPQAVAVATPAPAAPKMPAWESSPRIVPGARKRSAALPIALVAVVVLAAVGGYFYVRSQGVGTTSPAANAMKPQPAVTAPPVATAPAPSIPAETGTVVPVDTAPVLDPAQVQAEVQKRLAAERLRLEEAAREQQQAQQAAAATPPPAASRPAPAPVTAPPIQTTTQAAAAPPPPTPQPVVAQPQPQPVAPPPTATQAAETAPAAAEPPRIREGDLVPAGTEGLVPAKVLRRGNVPYPPLARAQRVEGTVIVNVLVSENGQVLDVRVIRGVTRPVGLNEAAEQIMRRSTFAPATKDGVKVRTWTTVPVDFKL